MSLVGNTVRLIGRKRLATPFKYLRILVGGRSHTILSLGTIEFLSSTWKSWVLPHDTFQNCSTRVVLMRSKLPRPAILISTFCKGQDLLGSAFLVEKFCQHFVLKHKTNEALCVNWWSLRTGDGWSVAMLRSNGHVNQNRDFQTIKELRVGKMLWTRVDGGPLLHMEKHLHEEWVKRFLVVDMI